MMKKLTLVLLILGVFGLFACRRSQSEATAYGITHKDYVGRAIVTVKNDRVENVSFEEAYLPSTWAKVQKGNEPIPAEAIADQGGNWYGKYLVIGDRKFTGEARTTPLSESTAQTIKYSASDVNDLYLWLRESEANCKWYYEQVTTNKAYVANIDWTRSTMATAGKTITGTSTLGFTKSETGYWPPSETTLGWKANMEAVTAALKGTKMEANPEDLTKGGTDNKYWMINGVVSGATLTDLKDYYALAKAAYNKALQQK